MPSEAEAVLEADVNPGDLPIETMFRAQYGRVSRVVARIIRDHARAEELAVEVFLRWSGRRRRPGDEHPEGWLYRAAVRIALDELRRRTRRERYERLFGFTRRSIQTPEEQRFVSEDQERVRAVLSGLRPREAELLILRSEGLQYAELATMLNLNPASIGTLLSRAQLAFKRDYVRRYGNQ